MSKTKSPTTRKGPIAANRNYNHGVLLSDVNNEIRRVQSNVGPQIHSGPPTKTTVLLKPIVTLPQMTVVPQQSVTEPLYDYIMSLFTDEGVVKITSKVPLSKQQIEAKTTDISSVGAVFLSADGLTATTYMPSSIRKIITTFSPAAKGEDK